MTKRYKEKPKKHYNPASNSFDAKVEIAQLRNELIEIYNDFDNRLTAQGNALIEILEHLSKEEESNEPEGYSSYSFEENEEEKELERVKNEQEKIKEELNKIKEQGKWMCKLCGKRKEYKNDDYCKECSKKKAWYLSPP